MLARDFRSRLTADQIVEACKNVRKWKPSRPEPILIPPATQLEEVAARYRLQERGYRDSKTKDHLKRICDSIAEGIDLYEQEKPFCFHRRVAGNAGDTTPLRIAGSIFPNSVWAAVRILVRFEPEPAIMLLSYVMLGHTENKEEVVMLIDEKETPEILSTSHPGDPSHGQLIQERALKEVERLSTKAAGRLSKSIGEQQ